MTIRACQRAASSAGPAYHRPLTTFRAPLTRYQRQALLFSGMLSLGGIMTLVVLLMAFQTLLHVRYMLVSGRQWPCSPRLLSQRRAALAHAHAERCRRLFTAAWMVAACFSVSIFNFMASNTATRVSQYLTEPTRWDLLGIHWRMRRIRAMRSSSVWGGGCALDAHSNAEYYVYGKAGRCSC